MSRKLSTPSPVTGRSATITYVADSPFDAEALRHQTDANVVLRRDLENASDVSPSERLDA